MLMRDGRPYPETLRCMLLAAGPAPLPLLGNARLRAGGADVRSDGGRVGHALPGEVAGSPVRGSAFRPVAA
jgi:hypothetical protein